MLSILIPIYDYNILPLVSELHKQCVENDIDFEILCQDDNSNSDKNIENEKVNLLSFCSFISLETNIAHRENRNQLALRAKYDCLLFIDGDSNILKNNYIKNYLKNIETFDVIYGGRLHPEKCPSKSQSLRWKYGKFIEDNLAEYRKKNKYKSLLFNNTLIKKSVFDRIKFDQKMKKYGHDDTQLSYGLSLLKARVHHIDNQIEHGDIDLNKVYLSKTKNSLENLLQLYTEKKINSDFVKLISLYIILKKSKLSFLAKFFYENLEKLIFKNLESDNPSLLVYNIFRIGYLCSLKPN